MSQNPIIRAIEASQLRDNLPDFRPGDTVRVHTLIKEGDKERIQVFEGVVIDRKDGGSRASFTVRKVSYGVGVERVFPLHSTRIDHIEVVVRGQVRRARLNYLRALRGKAARIKGEREVQASGSGKAAAAAAAAAANGKDAESAAASETPEAAAS